MSNSVFKVAFWFRWGVGVCMAAASAIACAQATLVGMRAYVQDGVEVLRLDFSQELTQLPRTFSLQSPARISLDFPGVANQLPAGKSNFDAGKLESAQVFSTPDRMRIVLGLKQNMGYSTGFDGKSLLVRFQAEPITAAPVQTAQATAAVPAVLPVLQDIDFKRSAQGGALITLTLPSTQTVADLRQQANGLTVDMDPMRLPPVLRRRLDVSDFATPVQAVTSTQVGERVRIAIETSGKWEFSSVQIGNLLTIEVKPPPQKSPALVKNGEPDVYTGEKLSLNFQSIDVRAVLQVIADFTKFNIVTSDTVTGTVTLRLEDVPWDQALDIILQSKALAMRKNGNVIWVAPKADIAAREKLELESQKVSESMEPLRTRSFQINYAKAADIAVQLTLGSPGSAPAAASAAPTTPPAGATAAPVSGRILSARGSVFAETRTNQVFVTDAADRLEQVQQYIAKVDIPVRQVLIEARLVVASEDFGRSLGVKLGGFDGSGGSTLSGNTRVGFGTSLDNAFITSGLATNKSTGTTLINPNYVNLPALSSTGAAVPSIAFTLFSASAGQLIGLELSALESNSNGKVVSSPRVLTMDQQPAIVSQGTQIPYSTVSSNGTQTQFQQANLKLEVTPQITPDGTLVLTLDISKDSLGIATAAGYAIDTKRVKTQALVENGGTVVIGGIYEMIENNAENKVPFFGDLPWIGALFKNNAKTTKKTELLVFITPKIVVDKNFGVR